MLLGVPFPLQNGRGSAAKSGMGNMPPNEDLDRSKKEGASISRKLSFDKTVSNMRKALMDIFKAFENYDLSGIRETIVVDNWINNEIAKKAFVAAVESFAMEQKMNGEGVQFKHEGIVQPETTRYGPEEYEILMIAHIKKSNAIFQLEKVDAFEPAKCVGIEMDVSDDWYELAYKKSLDN
jgi:hypothetical protein